MTTTTLRECDLRLGDIITARVGVWTPDQGRVEHLVEGICVQVSALFVGLADTGFHTLGGSVHARGSGLLMIGKHTEIETVRAPRGAVELDEWLDRPLILCERCS